MVSDAILAWAGALTDDTIGVNKILESIPVDDQEERPRKVRKFLTASMDDGVEMDPRELGADWPVLAIAQGNPFLAQAAGHKTLLMDGVVNLTAYYATGDAELAKAFRYGDRTLRAALHSTRLWLRGDSETAPLIHNGIEIVGLAQTDGAVQLGELLEEVQGGLISAALVVALRMKDQLTL